MSDEGAPGGPPRDGSDPSEPSARQGGRGGRRGRGRRGRGGRGGRPGRAARGETPQGERPRREAPRGEAARDEAPRGDTARGGRASSPDGVDAGARPSRDGRPARDGRSAHDAGTARDGRESRPAGRNASRNGNAGRARREVSAGGVVYRVVLDASGIAQPHFLLIRDSYRNWGFPKGHLERGELPDAAAVREVTEETGLVAVELRGVIETIDWYFRFRGRLIHKICHFYLMETERSETSPQVAEGITACRWAPFEEAVRLVSYANAREVLKRAHVMVHGGAPVAAAPTSDSSASQPADE